MPVNPNQPTRPRIHPSTGEVLQYATLPKRGKKLFRVCETASMIAQARLYRAVKRGMIEKQVAISDLYDYCFPDLQQIISKTQMGYIVTGAILYEPRLMVNNRVVGKPTMTYTFRHILDLQYGLEWMICTWFTDFFNEAVAPEEPIGSMGELEAELDALGNSEDTEYLDIYETRLWKFVRDEPDWKAILERNHEDELPSPKVEITGKKPRSFQ